MEKRKDIIYFIYKDKDNWQYDIVDLKGKSYNENNAIKIGRASIL